MTTADAVLLKLQAAARRTAEQQLGYEAYLTPQLRAFSPEDVETSISGTVGRWAPGTFRTAAAAYEAERLRTMGALRHARNSICHSGSSYVGGVVLHKLAHLHERIQVFTEGLELGDLARHIAHEAEQKVRYRFLADKIAILNYY